MLGSDRSKLGIGVRLLARPDSAQVARDYLIHRPAATSTAPTITTWRT